jgi:hypothetical protein
MQVVPLTQVSAPLRVFVQLWPDAIVPLKFTLNVVGVTPLLYASTYTT